MTHLNIWNTSYGQKKHQKSNEQFDSCSLKVENWPDFLMHKWSVTYCWKSANEGYNFALDLIVIKGLHTKLWAPKITRISTVGIPRFLHGNHLGVPRWNVIWMWASWRGTKLLYVKDIVVVKLFPSICPSCHPSSLDEGIPWLPILLLQQPPIFPFHHLLLQSHHLRALRIFLPHEEASNELGTSSSNAKGECSVAPTVAATTHSSLSSSSPPITPPLSSGNK